MENNILWFQDVSMKDIAMVGGKNASLGEMYQKLTSKHVQIPNGFCITSKAYSYFLESTGVMSTIREILEDLDVENIHQLQKKGNQIRKLIINAKLPKDLENEIVQSYRMMEDQYGKLIDVAVRSSATAEDLPDASFAGQQETFLNVSGENDLLESCKKCFASLFTDRAISYRENKEFDHFKVKLSIGVQKMVRSISSGVMFTIDTESGFKDVILINASWGLGENIVQGNVIPDEWIVFKPKLKEGFRPIIKKKLGTKNQTMIYSKGTTKGVKNIATSIHKKNQFCLTDDDVLELANLGKIIEEHYCKSMDIEWGKDERDGKLYILQARPETIHSMKKMNILKEYKIIDKKGEKLLVGDSVGRKISNGKARLILDVENINEFQSGEILVTDMTDPNWEPILKKASGIITNRGGRTCHAAIISREIGVPCIVGTNNGTEILKQGQEITVDCSGSQGIVWKGFIKYQKNEIDISDLKKTKTKLLMNIANPDTAFDMSFIPNDGIGLARMEFIISDHIGIHPLSFIHYDKLNSDDQKKFSSITNGYKRKEDFFIDKLSQGIGTIASAFYPKPVVLRFSDFKTNEYETLLGGNIFEPKEENPMLGWRGASRYYDLKYSEGFKLECESVKKVREEFGLDNLQLMIPFCRTVDEANKVIQELENNGISRTKENNLKIYGMCEIPSNVILSSEFLKVFDGYSIGSNDLTQLVLGVDRDSPILKHLYNENDESVKLMISKVIETCHSEGKYISICGQAPSDYPLFCEFLVEKRIDSISLNSDVILETMIKIHEIEQKILIG